MRYFSRYHRVVLAGFLTIMVACHKSHTVKEIDAAMQQYDQLIKKMDADSIALLFTADGQLGDMARGRDSIRRFLLSFKNVRVLEVSSRAKTTTLSSDSATQAGTYRQVALVNEKDTIHVKGEYVAKWKWETGEGWRLHKMTTTPTN